MPKQRDLNLRERGLKLSYDAGRALNSPSAMLLPSNIRALVEDLAALVRDLAAVAGEKDDDGQ